MYLTVQTLKINKQNSNKLTHHFIKFITFFFFQIHIVTFIFISFILYFNIISQLQISEMQPNQIFTLLNYIQQQDIQKVTIQKQQIEGYCQRLSQTYNFKGMFGIYKYMIMNQNARKYLNKINSLISLLYMFVDAPMNSSLLYDFWSVFKILMLQCFQNSECDVQSLGENLFKIIDYLMTYTSQKQPSKNDQSLKIYLVQFIRQFLLKIGGGRDKISYKKITTSSKQIAESTITNKKAFEILCLFLIINFQLTIFIKDKLQTNYVIGFVQAMQKKTRVYDFVRFFEIVVNFSSRLFFTCLIKKQNQFEILKLITNIVHLKIKGFYINQFTNKSLIIRVLTNSSLIQDILQIIDHQFTHPKYQSLHQKSQLMLECIQTIIKKQLTNSRIQTFFQVNNIISIIKPIERQLLLIVQQLILASQTKNDKFKKFLQQKNTQQFDVQFLFYEKYLSLSIFQQAVIIYQGVLKDQQKSNQLIQELSQSQLQILIRNLFIGYRMGFNQIFITKFLQMIINKIKLKVGEIVAKPKTFVDIIKILTWIQVILKSCNQIVWVCHNCEISLESRRICLRCDCLTRNFSWSIEKVNQIQILSQQLKNLLQIILMQCSKLKKNNNFKGTVDIDLLILSLKFIKTNISQY